MKLTIDRNCNIIIDSTRTGFVAVGAHSIAGETSVRPGYGHHYDEKGKTYHVTSTTDETLWTGHVTDLTVEAFTQATGYRLPDTIVITAPAGTKNRWVRQSQREGMKLSEWVNKHVEASMKNQIQARIVIPSSVNFADLHLARDTATGDVALDWAPIEQICQASGLDIRIFRDQSEDNLGGLLAQWYAQHRAAGGLPDPAMDDLIGEADIEDTHGHSQSYKPGRA